MSHLIGLPSADTDNLNRILIDGMMHKDLEKHLHERIRPREVLTYDSEKTHEALKVL